MYAPNNKIKRVLLKAQELFRCCTLSNITSLWKVHSPHLNADHVHSTTCKWNVNYVDLDWWDGKGREGGCALITDCTYDKIHKGPRPTAKNLYSRPVRLMVHLFCSTPSMY